MKPRGLTLVEWIILVGLVVLLAALLLPAVSHHHVPSRRAICMAQVRQLMLACKQYAIDHKGVFPRDDQDVAKVFLQITNGLAEGQFRTAKLFHCPSDEPTRTGRPLTAANISYAYVSGLSEEDSCDCPLVMDRGIAGACLFQPATNLVGHLWLTNSAHLGDGGNVAFVDGHAMFMKKSPFGPPEPPKEALTNAVALFPEGPVTGNYPKPGWWSRLWSR